jgi:hypothetical protein
MSCDRGITLDLVGTLQAGPRIQDSGKDPQNVSAGATKVTKPVAPFGQHVTWDWEKKNSATSKKEERSGNVIENKGPALKTGERSRNVIDGKGDRFQKPECY